MTRDRNQRDRTQVMGLFPELSSCPDGHYLALRPYIWNCPERLFDRVAYECFLEWLKDRDRTDSPGLRKYLDEHGPEINRALLFLREINLESWHDELPKKGDEYDLVRFIDKHIHPAYLRLVEAVLIPLVRVVAYFSRLDRGKGTDGLDVWSTVQELFGSTTGNLVVPYRHIVRNGIAHGGITYLQDKIRYWDKQGKEEEFDASAIVRLCDDLLDVGNGLAAALKLFLIIARQKGYALPQELLLEELQEETRSPWWRIDGCVPCEIGAQRQLVVYARPNSRDRAKIQMATIQSGILAEFFAPGYERYFFSLCSPKAWRGWAGFDGEKLAVLRSSGTSDINRYQGVVENDSVFYVPRFALPRWLAKIDTLLQILRVNWSLTMAQQRQKLGVPDVISRNASIHRNAWGSVLNADVVIDQLVNDRAMDLVRRWRRRIVNTALRAGRRNAGLVAVAHYLPLAFARISIFRKDYRRRRLANFGLGVDLVCTLQFQRLGRIRCPDIWGSTIEATGNWRIAWNRAWLEDVGQQEDALDGYSAGVP